MTLLLEWSDERQRADLVVENGSFKQDPTLESVVLVSLLTNRRADESAGIPLADDRQGWWGDFVASPPGEEYGSLIWLYSIGNTTTEVAEQIRREANARLQWLVKDGLLQKIEVTAEYDDERRLILTVKRTLNDGSEENSVFEVNT